MRRGVGIGAVNKKQLEEKKFAVTANQIQENQIEKLTQQMEKFKTFLEEFAFKYKNEIKSDPAFRKQFQDMCANIGVDPLASSKGFWSDILGVGDFYYELAVQIIEICNSYQDSTGGLLYLDFIYEKIRKVRGKYAANNLSLDDLIRSIKKLHMFGNGFTLISMKNNRYMVQSVPNELNMDHTTVVQLAEATNGCLTFNDFNNLLGWELYRINNVLEFMIKEGLVWIDNNNNSINNNIKSSSSNNNGGQSNNNNNIKYYFPGFYLASL